METGVHNSWRLSPWSKKLHGAGLFIVDEEEGQIEVPEAGLYLVYAQVGICCTVSKGTVFLKRSAQCLVFKDVLKSQESKFSPLWQ